MNARFSIIFWHNDESQQRAFSSPGQVTRPRGVKSTTELLTEFLQTCEFALKKRWVHLRLAWSLAYVINKAYFKKGLFHSTKLICDMQFHCYQIWSYVPTAQDGSVAKKVHMKKYAFIKKSTISTKSLRNFAKMTPSWLPYFDKVS